MKKLVFRGLMLLLMAAVLAGSCLAAQTLIPVGSVVGMELDAAGLTVVDFDRELGKNAKKAGLQIGDIIVKADGVDVTTAQDLQQLVDRAQETLIVTVLRDGKAYTMGIQPTLLEGGKRLGIYIREGITGIGTVTYFDPESGSFGALGHGVSSSGGTLLPMECGTVVAAHVTDIQKGKNGTPGQLHGSFAERNILGQLQRNTFCGVFGTSCEGWSGIPLPIGQRGEIHTGDAVLLSNLAGGDVCEYDVEIVRVYSQQDTQGRNMLLHITDPTLLERTGGIVQGM